MRVRTEISNHHQKCNSRTHTHKQTNGARTDDDDGKKRIIMTQKKTGRIFVFRFYPAREKTK